MDAAASRRPWHQIPCTRVASDGRRVTEFRYPGAEVDLWLEFNLRHRPAEALIIGEEVRQFSTAFPDLESLSIALKGARPWLHKRPLA